MRMLERLRRVDALKLALIIPALVLAAGLAWLLVDEAGSESGDELTVRPSPPHAARAAPPADARDTPRARHEATATRQARDRDPRQGRPRAMPGASERSGEPSRPRRGDEQASGPSQRREARRVIEQLLGVGGGAGARSQPPAEPPEPEELLGGLKDADRGSATPPSSDSDGLLGIGGKD